VYIAVLSCVLVNEPENGQTLLPAALLRASGALLQYPADRERDASNSGGEQRNG